MPHFFIEIYDFKENFASPSELDLRHRLVNAIEAEKLGAITGSGSGFGGMDLSVETADIDGIKGQLTMLVLEFVPNDRFTISEIETPSEKEEDVNRLNKLGQELGPQICKHPNCDRLRIAMSVFCRIHHFEQIWGRQPSCDSNS